MVVQMGFRFNGAEFLLRMKGKNIMFAGDSLGKNQWESLICLIMSSAPSTRTQMTRGLPLSTFRFLVHTFFLSLCIFLYEEIEFCKKLCVLDVGLWDNDVVL